MQLSDRIKKIRKYLDLSQLVFSQALGVSRGHISNIETGAAVPSKQLLKLICKQWGVDEKWLKSGDSNMKVKYRSNITKEDDIDYMIETSIAGKYHILKNNLTLLSNTIENLVQFFDNQEIIFAITNDFILEPQHPENKRVIKQVSTIKQSIDKLQNRLNKMLELKNIDELE